MLCVIVCTPFTLFLLFVFSYSSGGEDGYVRVHTFDPVYFDFEVEC